MRQNQCQAVAYRLASVDFILFLEITGAHGN
jgi:hypothetical protein